MLGSFTKESPPLISRASDELLKVYQSEELSGRFSGMPVENSKTFEDTRGILLEVLNAKNTSIEKMGDDQDPGERVRKLVQFAGQVHVDNSIAPKKYFRSGIEMEKMVSLYSVVHKLTTSCRQISQAGVDIN